MGAVIGVDIGQRREPSGLCVAEHDLRKEDGSDILHYMIRHLERLPAGTQFPKIADRVSEVASGVYRKTRERPHLLLDVTGLGSPVVDLIREASKDYGRISEVYFTHGDQCTEEMVSGRSVVRLGKAYLVSKLQTMLQTARLHLPKNEQTDILRRELMDFEIEIDEKANERYGAFRVGAHDDLVTALGMSLQDPLRKFWIR